MKMYWTILIAMIGIASAAEARTWTLVSGETVEGEYKMYAFEKVYVILPDKKEVKIPIENLSEEDRNYVELENPPTLKVEYRKSEQPKQYVADPWTDNFGSTHDNHPIFVTPAKYGAEIFQKSLAAYDHEMTVEIMVFSKQYYDPDNYHIIARTKSKPFKLTKANDFHFEFEDPKTYTIIKYNLYSTLPRGETLGEYLVLVRDERGEIIGFNGTKKWITKYLDKIEALPVGAWINDKGVRIHPTSPNWDT